MDNLVKLSDVADRRRDDVSNNARPHRITFDLIDGVPDLASILMEEL